MKLFLRKILIRTLQPFGFYITYYASADRVYESLRQYPNLIQEYELKRIFDTITIAGNHKFYNELISKFIPSWNLSIQESTFIGFGAGESSLSSFRKVKLSNKNLHEKIYFSSHQDLKRIGWFHKNVSHLVQSYGIALPSVYEIYSGDAITVVYSDYVDLKQLDTISKEENLVRFTLRLYELSLTEEFKSIINNASPSITDFKSHFEYKRNREVAKNLLGEHGISLESLEEQVSKTRYVLTHGDIQETNAFQNHVLIDWDSVGVFPVGLDAAFLLFYLFLDDKNEQLDILNWMDIHYKNVIQNSEWQSFQLSFLYFLFVFIQRRIKNNKLAILNNEIPVLLKEKL